MWRHGKEFHWVPVSSVPILLCSDSIMWERRQERRVIMKEWAGGWLCSACTVYIHHCQDSLRGIIYSPMGCMAPHTLLIFIWPEREKDRVGSSEFSIHFSSSQSVSRGRMKMAVSGHAEIADAPVVQMLASWSTCSAVTAILRNCNSCNTNTRFAKL